jgi:predicted nucleic acid-binding protein
MTFVDTGYLVALVSPADAHHARALAWSFVALPPFIVTEYVLVEVMNLLSRPKDRSRAIHVADRIFEAADFRFVAASEELLRSGLALYRRREDKSWSLTDCVSFVVMNSRGISEALAHDEHFVQAGFDALLRRDPD